ncbi:MAG: DoxX family protein [Acidimicrobiia bacterium]|nr:DoxX family protein [Acidimicrobiia bacterium]
MNHDKVLWVLQWVFGLYFIGVGVIHFILPEGLPQMMSWMYELDDNLHLTSGIAEILGGLGLILPGLVRIRPELTILAALGLIGVMIGAVVWHIGRDEYATMVTNLINIGVLSYIAYGRFKLAPLPGRSRISNI